MENDGLTLETAIVLENVNNGATGTHLINRIVEKMFGGDDGDYFIHSEQVAENKKTGKKYKILYVEDQNGTKRSVFFDVTNWG